jgi:hypothetical protein
LSIFDKGVQENVDLEIKIVDSRYVTSEIFTDYLRRVLIPRVKSNRSIPGCQSKPAIRFCVNCTCHCPDDVKLELAEHGMMLITYFPSVRHSGFRPRFDTARTPSTVDITHLDQCGFNQFSDRHACQKETFDDAESDFPHGF